MARRLHIVDVFTDRACAGTTLAVMLGADGLSSRQMQSFAREMNFEVTSFVTAAQPVGGAWPVRVYTPRRELPFAGFPALGTAHVLRSGLYRRATERVTLDLPGGQVPVVIERSGRRELNWMRLPQARIGARLSRRHAAAALGLAPSDIDAKHPPLEILAGLGFLVVPLRSRAALARASIDRRALAQLVAPLEGKAVLAFAPGASEARNQFTARVFFDHYGEGEAIASGSANGCLAAWLVETRFLGDDAADVRVEQGAPLGRPAVLHLRAMRTSHGIQVQVGGGVVDVASGTVLAARYA